MNNATAAGKEQKKDNTPKIKSKKRKLNEEDVSTETNQYSSSSTTHANSNANASANVNTSSKINTVAIPSTNNLPSNIVNPDFATLATIYPDFATQWQKLKKRQQQQQRQNQRLQLSEKNTKVSFSTHVDFEFNVALTRAILNEYFQLSLPSLPVGNLCPPIPNRLNYVLWIKDLLHDMFDCGSNYFDLGEVNDTHNDDNANDNDNDGQNKEDQYDTNYYSSRSKSYRGMDIGTGASCIYPLLLSSKYFSHDDDEHDQMNDNNHTHNHHHNEQDQNHITKNTTQKKKMNQKQWQFLGTDIDSYSIQCAQQNINANQLQDVIKVILVPPTTDQSNSIRSIQRNDGNEDYHDKNCDTKKLNVIDTDDDDACNHFNNQNNVTPLHAAMDAASIVFRDTTTTTSSDSTRSSHNSKCSSDKHIPFDFCMTNPPFYSTIDDATKPRSGDARTRTPMTAFESVYPGNPIGGEVKFVFDMIQDSVLYKHEITWFSAMLGKKNSYNPIEKKLESLGLGIGSIRKTEFIQGKMMRWGIAWTFRKPSIKSKATLVKEETTNFIVTFDKPLSHLNALDEISNRISSFSTNYYKGSGKLNCYQGSKDCVTITLMQKKAENSNSTSNSSTGETAFCDKSEITKDVEVESHNSSTCQFAIDVSYSINNNNDRCNNDNTTEISEQHNWIDSVTVQTECYCHFKKALDLIHNFNNQIIGEVGRTNRRWRRLRQKEKKKKSG